MTKQEIAEANRRRYEAMRAAGQGAEAKPLPPPTAIGGAPLADAEVIARETVPYGWYHSVRLKRGEALRIVDETGRSSVSLVGWCTHDPSERLNCADTVKVQWKAVLSKGRVILTDMGRVFLSVIEDTSGAHDLLVGGSSAASAEGDRNTQDNFLAAASKHGLSLADIPPCVTFFAPVSVDEKGRFVWTGARKKAGDFVDLRAECDLLLILSNCAHPLDPARPAAGGNVTIVHHRAGGRVDGDPRRFATPEIARAFAFTDRLHA
ncbi:MAG TPA: urea amidolyase associated protein UAAP1 [Reyranella sp.]|nr:urea amidolyase associated protein UAAP1 [Reyranella sp.]